MSGRSVHTMTGSPPSPLGMSMRAMTGERTPTRGSHVRADHLPERLSLDDDVAEGAVLVADEVEELGRRLADALPHRGLEAPRRLVVHDDRGGLLERLCRVLVV